MKVYIVNYRGTNYAAFSTQAAATEYADTMFGPDVATVMGLTLDAVNLESLKALA